MNTNQYDLFNQSPNQATPAVTANKAPSKTPKQILATQVQIEIWRMLSPEFSEAAIFLWFPYIHNQRAITNPGLKEIMDKTFVCTTNPVTPEFTRTIQTEAYKALFDAVHARKGNKTKIICNLNKHRDVIFNNNFNNLRSIAIIMDLNERTIKNALKNCQNGGV